MSLAEPAAAADPAAADLERATAHQRQAAAALLPALPPRGHASHAYLFHGPAGSGKRRAARAFAAALLADGDGGQTAERIATRVAANVHPDLTWVRPSGAAEMLVSDIDEPVVAAATRTPFEARRRVFVIEGADRMNERAANRMLKTLEEPPSFVHLILLAQRRADVIATIVSRCQAVRFDPPPPAEIERRLIEPEPVAADAPGPVPGTAGADRAALPPRPPVEPATAAACARLCHGDMALARRLAGPEGVRLRAAAEAMAVAALAERPIAAVRPWTEMLEAAREAAAQAAERMGAAMHLDVELLAARERRRHEREAAEALRRAERRERTAALEMALRLVELWLRDLLCITEGTDETIHAVDRRPQLQECTQRRHLSSTALRRAIEITCETRLRLPLNVSEELALETLGYRLQETLSRLSR